MIEERRIAYNMEHYADTYNVFLMRDGPAWFEAITGEEMDVERIYRDIHYLAKCIEDASDAEELRERLKNKIISRESMIEAIDEILGNNEERSNGEYRRLLVALGTPPWVNMDKIKAIYRKRDRITKATGIKHHVDHVIPIQGVLVCGLHVETNLDIIPAKENLAKSNKFEIEC